MFIKQLIFLSLILFPFFGNAQIGDVINEDRTRKISSRSSRPAPQSKTKRLAHSITRGRSSEATKSKAIFNWIAKNIDYDNELHTNKSLQKQVYTSEANVIKMALERKKALCGGYAMLFKQLCAEVGIDAAVVHGYTKLHAGQVRTSNKVNHTWNAVKINGRWKLLDITWAKSHSRDGSPNLFWYHTAPSDFIKTHYPQNKKWALQRNVLSLVEFDKLLLVQ